LTYHRIDIFEQVLELAGLGLAALKESLAPKLNRESVFKAGESAGGSSGSFFFFSQDRKFLIKTMSPHEMKLFLSKLP
jgi:hypothetical protein